MSNSRWRKRINETKGDFMLELKTYSKKELGELLNVSYSRTDIITKKLKKKKKKKKTTGRGDN